MTALLHHAAVQQSVYELLSEDATLQGLVTGVYDHVPHEAALPYLTLGDALARGWDASAMDGIECGIALHAYSREGGRKQASGILQRVHELMRKDQLAVAGYEVVQLRYVSSAIRLQNDGATYHGEIRYRLLLQV